VAAVNDPHEEFHGKNILYVAHTVQEAARQFNTSEQEIKKRLAQIRSTLLAARNQRPRPHLDDKVLTSCQRPGARLSGFTGAAPAAGC